MSQTNHSWVWQLRLIVKDDEQVYALTLVTHEHTDFGVIQVDVALQCTCMRAMEVCCGPLVPKCSLNNFQVRHKMEWVGHSQYARVLDGLQGLRT